MSRLPSLLLSAALVAAAAGLLPAYPAASSEIPAAEDWLIEHGRVLYDLEGVERLEVIQRFGDVRIKGIDGDQIVVTFAVQRHREDPRGPAFQTVVEEGTRRLVPGFELLEIEDHPDWQRRRIDIGIDLPRQVALSVTTDDGLIDVAELEAGAQLTSSSGEIRFEGAGALEARSEHGRVRALVRSTATTAAFSVSSLTGNITAWLLKGADAELHIETHGTIATDYSIDIEREPGRRHKRARAITGRGHRRLTLASHEGDISILALGADESATKD